LIGGSCLQQLDTGTGALRQLCLRQTTDRGSASIADRTSQSVPIWPGPIPALTLHKGLARRHSRYNVDIVNRNGSRGYYEKVGRNAR
jgi:hypothetical protein